MDLSFIGDIFTSGGLGGLIGGVTGILMKIQERKEKQADQEHERNMAALTNEQTRLEQDHELAIADKEIDKAEKEGEILIESREADAFVESQKRQPTGGGLRWVRPLVTAYLLLLATYISARVFISTGGVDSLPGDVQSQLLIQVVNDVFFLTIMAVSWYFGARGTSRR